MDFEEFGSFEFPIFFSYQVISKRKPFNKIIKFDFIWQAVQESKLPFCWNCELFSHYYISLNLYFFPFNTSGDFFFLFNFIK